MLGAYRGVPDPGQFDPNAPDPSQQPQPDASALIASLLQGGGAAPAQPDPAAAPGAPALAALAAAAPPPAASPPGPPIPPPATAAPAGGGAAPAPAGGILGALASRVGNLGFKTEPSDTQAALRQGMLAAGASMMANAAKPVTEGGGWGALGTGLGAGFAGVNASLQHQAAAEEQERKDDAAESDRAATLGMEAARLKEEQAQHANQERLRQAEESKMAAAEQKAKDVQIKDAQARVAALRNVQDADKTRMLLGAMGGPPADWWKAYYQAMADPRTQMHEVPGVGLVVTNADGSNTHVVVKEVRKPETDLFTPVTNPQTGDVAAFDRRTGNLVTGQGNIGARGGTMDHDTAAVVRALSSGTADPDFINSFKKTKPVKGTDADGNPTTTQVLDLPATIANYKALVAAGSAPTPGAPGKPAAAPPPPPPELAQRYARDPAGVRAEILQRWAPADAARILKALGAAAP
jgi:hypothetical protein